MFEDILNYPDRKPDNVIVVCGVCGVKIVEIINDINNDAYVIDTHDHLCRQCTTDFAEGMLEI